MPGRLCRPRALGGLEGEALLELWAVTVKGAPGGAEGLLKAGGEGGCSVIRGICCIWETPRGRGAEFEGVLLCEGAGAGEGEVVEVVEAPALLRRAIRACMALSHITSSSSVGAQMTNVRFVVTILKVCSNFFALEEMTGEAARGFLAAVGLVGDASDGEKTSSDDCALELAAEAARRGLGMPGGSENELSRGCGSYSSASRILAIGMTRWGFVSCKERGS